MAYCCKCGKEINEGLTCCVDCQEDAPLQTSDVTAEKEDLQTAPKKKGKFKRFISDNKHNVVTGAGDAVVSFIVKKRLVCAFYVHFKCSNSAFYSTVL